MVQNADGTFSFDDVTTYMQNGDTFGAKDINDTNTAVNELNNNLDSLGKSVSDGKTLVANAITAKGITTATDASFQTMADNILSINVTKLITVTFSINGSISTWISGNCRAVTSGTVAVAVYYADVLIASKSFNYVSPEAVGNTQTYYKDDSFNANI